MPDANMVSWLVNAGLGGVVALAFLRRWVVAGVTADRDEKQHEEELKRHQEHHDKEIARLEKEAERWRRLHERECAAHETTRRAHNEEIRPGLAASTEAARTAVHLLAAAKQLTSGAGTGERQ